MAWINLVPTRNTQLAFVRTFVEAGRPPEPRSILLPLAQSAIEVGDEDGLRAVLELGRPIYEDTIKRRATKAFLSDRGAMGTILSLSCAYHIGGEDQTRLWASVKALGKPRDPVLRAVLGLLETDGSSNASPAVHARASEPKYPRDEKQMVSAVEKYDRQTLLDIVNSPDHANFGPIYQYFVLPLSIDVGKRIARKPIVPASLGARPDRRGTLMYSRTVPRSEDDATDAVVHDFDAVEGFGDSVVAYHYVGLRWANASKKTVLSFDGDGAASSFLNSLEEDWARVRGAVSKDVWAQIDAARGAGRCTHVVAYDPERTVVPDEVVASAASRYGVRLVAKSLFDV